MTGGRGRCQIKFDMKQVEVCPWDPVWPLMAYHGMSKVYSERRHMCSLASILQQMGQANWANMELVEGSLHVASVHARCRLG